MTKTTKSSKPKPIKSDILKIKNKITSESIEQKAISNSKKTSNENQKHDNHNKKDNTNVISNKSTFQYFTDSDDDSFISNPIAYIPDDLSFNPSDYDYETDDFSEEGNWVLTPATKARRILHIIKLICC